MTKCQPTRTPDDIDIPALREKYRHERDKRIRSDAGTQYVEADGDFAEYYEVDPHKPVTPREPIREEIEVAILGGGFSGLLAAARLKEAGVDGVHIIDHAGDFGGVWYWNRYPGIQCDNESYCYLPLLEETGYMPTKRFIDGAEIYEHCQRIGHHFGLYDNAIFHTLIKSLVWDEAIARWRIGTNRHDEILARFVIIGGGPANRPKLPGVPGIHSFKGHKFHSARWDYAYTGGDPTGATGRLDNLHDKKVALIGTGATGIQLVPHLSHQTEHLYVFQRTPSSVDERPNPATDPEWVKTLKPGWKAERQANFHAGAIDGFAPGQVDLVCDLWTEINRNMQSKMEAAGWPQLSFEQFMAMREVEDYQVMERLRRRVAGIVEDPETAEALKPYYRFLCKRPTSNDEYLQAFNRPNVTLVDVSASKGVDRMTEKGIVANGVEYEVDCVIFASGFEITTDIDRRWGIDAITGRDGRSLYDHWRKGYKTFHGLSVHGFPNQFHNGYTQVGLAANVTAMFDQQVSHIAWIIKETLARGATTVEPSAEAEAEWCRIIRETAFDLTQFQRECTPGYYNNEGAQELRSNTGEPYGPGFYAYGQVLDGWRDQGDMEGMMLGK
jgi:cyclohexanone monooxygenase